MTQTERIAPDCAVGFAQIPAAQAGRDGFTGQARRVVTEAAMTEEPRVLAEETAIALSYNGSTHAVMMATPCDLRDFALGFTLTEGLASPSEIEDVQPVTTALGIDLQVWLAEGAADRLSARRRSMAGPVGCGLCGIDSLEEAMRRAPAVPPSSLTMTGGDVRSAAASLRGHQPLHDITRAVHAAGFWLPGQGIVAAREDVGRHNALDKLAGALIAAGVDPTQGAIVMTSRVSVDLVQKCARIGAPVLIAASAPTAAGVALAEQAGITVAALVRPDRFELFTHPDRIGAP